MTDEDRTDANLDIRVEEWESGITRVTIDRPHVRNAYRTQTAVELARAVADFDHDDDQRVLVVTGADGAFCAGGDLSSSDEVEQAHAAQFGHGRVMREGMHRVQRAMELCDKPVVAMVRGPAVAGGLALALACDIRIADTTARLGDTSGRVGLLPDEGGAWFLTRAMGADRALRMIWGSEVLDAQQSLDAGLLTEVVEPETLETAVLDLARRLAATAPLTTKVVKRMVRHAEHQTLDQALHEAELAVSLINDTQDVREGVAAFLDKRSPRFTGR